MTIPFSRAALIIIDVQNDFCPGGALEVKNGDEVIEPLNRLASLFASHQCRVVATQDWHPPDHVSFAASHVGKAPGETVNLPGSGIQVLWPVHCVQGTRGAAFHEGLDLGKLNLIIRKGFCAGMDSYSAFFENDHTTSTGLNSFFRALSIDTLVLGGLATDYCVLYNALDAAALGYKTIVAGDAVRGVNLLAGSVDQAYRQLAGAGVIVADSGDF